MPRASSRSSSSARASSSRAASSMLGRACSGRAVDAAPPREPELQRQRDEPLLGAVVQVALQAPALGMPASTIRAREACSSSRRARSSASRRSFSSASAAAAATARDQLGLLGERAVVDDRADAPPVALDLGRRAARAGRRAASTGRPVEST